MSLVIVDSGTANLASVTGALKRLAIDATVSSDPATIRAASRVILPGVGSAAAAMASLRAKNLPDTLRALTQPVLGICLGMQLLFTHSQEGDGCECLGLIPANITRLPAQADQPIPHMGWNTIKWRNKTHHLLRDIADNSFVYFVHSFAAPLGDYTLASCDYSESFTAVAGHHNFFGCQFHPERSGLVGQQILKNFMGL